MAVWLWFNRVSSTKSSMNATINVVCYKWKTLTNGEYPLMLRICKDGKKKYQSLGISVLPRYWDFTRNKPKPNCPNKEYIQKIILDKQTELQQRMLEFNSEQKEYTTTTLLNDENKRFELKTVCQFYQEQIEQCKVLCKQKIRNSFLNPVFSIYTKYFIAPYFL